MLHKVLMLGTCNVLILVIMKLLRGYANRKGWVLKSSGGAQQKMVGSQRYALHCTIWYKLCWMMRLLCFLKNAIFAEAANTAMLLKKNNYKVHRLKTITTIFWEGKEKCLDIITKFDKICILTYHDNTYQVRLAKWYTEAFWVGFVDGNPVGTFKLLSPKTKNIWHASWPSWQVIQHWNKVDKHVFVPVSYDGSGNKDKEQVSDNNNIDDDYNIVVIWTAKRKKKPFGLRNQGRARSDSWDHFE